MVYNLIKELVIDHDVNVARQHIKCFLTVYDIFDKHIPKKSKNTIRNDSKPLHNGYHSGWQKHLLTNALDAMA
jgi:hypothetical protein